MLNNTDNDEIYKELLIIIPELHWYEHTVCSIAADIGDNYMMVASKGHAGYPFKTFTVEDKHRDIDIIKFSAPPWKDEYHKKYPKYKGETLVDAAYNHVIDEKNLSRIKFFGILSTKETKKIIKNGKK